MTFQIDRNYLVGLLLLLLSDVVSAASVQIPWIWDQANPPPGTLHAAILTQHLLLKDNSLLHRGRATKPNISGPIRITPVLHVQVDVFSPTSVPNNFHDEIINAMLDAAAASTSGWVQLDYEARPNQRIFYRALVHDIKKALPNNIKLSVTALAWWCRSAAWLDELDADEVVPMFFRMGKDSERLNIILDESPNQLHKSCRASTAGFAIQEPPSTEILSRYNKVYWFDYSRWKGNAQWPPAAKL